jgi:hypothetical protein
MTDLNLKLHISKVIETGSLTALVQTLANSGLQSYLSRSSYPCVGITTFKESSLVFTASGVYAEMPAMLQTLEDIAVQHSQSARR